MRHLKVYEENIVDGVRLDLSNVRGSGTYYIIHGDSLNAIRIFKILTKAWDDRYKNDFVIGGEMNIDYNMDKDLFINFRHFLNGLLYHRKRNKNYYMFMIEFHDNHISHVIVENMLECNEMIKLMEEWKMKFAGELIIENKKIIVTKIQHNLNKYNL